MRSVVRVHLSPDGGVAQLGEHLPCKQGVMSSNLTISTLAMSNAGFGSGTDSASLLADGCDGYEDDSAKHVTK